MPELDLEGIISELRKKVTDLERQARFRSVAQMRYEALRCYMFGDGSRGSQFANEADRLARSIQEQIDAEVANERMQVIYAGSIYGTPPESTFRLIGIGVPVGDVDMGNGMLATTNIEIEPIIYNYPDTGTYSYPSPNFGYITPLMARWPPGSIRSSQEPVTSPPD